jgi:hypothetical protein
MPINSARVEAHLLYPMLFRAFAFCAWLLPLLHLPYSCMVRIMFAAYSRTPVISPRFAPMASEDLGDVSVGRWGSSTEQLNMSLVDDQVLASVEATSEQDAAFDEENPTRDTGDSRNASDDGSCVKIGAKATLVDVSYDFRQSNVTTSCSRS